MKAAIRRRIAALRAALSADERVAASAAIAERLYALDAWREAGWIHAYVGVGPEVDTRPILERAWAEGKRVACPKVVWRPRGLVSYAVTSFDDLGAGRRGLLEPDPDRTQPIGEAVDLVLVPGLAFDRDGGRIGYGAGFYDRFLATTGAMKVALAYSLQLIDEVPVEPHDVTVDRILTEGESIVCGVASGGTNGKEERA